MHQAQPTSGPAAGRGGRLAAIDGLRGLAALCVIFFHIHFFSHATFPAVPGLDQVLGLGHVGVNLFLLLSGFCLYLPFAGGRTERWNARTFYGRRAARLLPAYLASWVLALALNVLLTVQQSAEALNLQQLLVQFATHLTFTHTLFPDTFYGLNGAYWTLGLEWHLYLLLPVLLAGVRRWGIGRVVALVVAGVLLYNLALAWVLGHRIVDAASVLGSVVLPNQVWARMGEFALGMLVAELYVRGLVRFDAVRGIPLRAVAVVAAFVAAIGAIAMLPGAVNIVIFGTHDPVLNLRPLVFGVAFFALLLVVVHGDNPVSRAFAWRPLVGLGTMSYSLYLVHEPFIRAIVLVARQTLSPVQVFGLLVAALPLMWVLARVLFVLVESRTVRKPPTADPAPPPRRAAFAWWGRGVSLLLLLSIGGGLFWSGRAEGAAALPTGFEDTQIASVYRPTALAWTPDNRMVIATQPGRLRLYVNNALVAAPALDLSARICTDFERGMLGVAVDPQFTTNNYIYLYYTFKKNGVCTRNSADSPVNRVSRFTLPASNTIDPATELVLIDNIPSPNGNHNSGDLQFGKDGLLYISVGDGGCHYADSSRCAVFNEAARDRSILLGKILRITTTGAIPSTNPYRGTGTARCNTAGRTTAGTICQEIFAWGLRNPFRMIFDPNASATRFYINDVGQSVWEEIDEGAAGADYGWNTREGFCVRGSTSNCGAPPAGMTDPVYAYGHGDGCASISGGAFVPRGVWPARYDGTFLFGDYVCGKIWMLPPGGTSAETFVSDLGNSSVVTMRFGPHGASQALYYTSYLPNNTGGSIHRITYSGATNRAPQAVISANPTSGEAPLPVAFDGTGSSDPDGDTLRYAWDWGDGTAGATTASAQHTYTANGTYTARLTVTDEAGLSSSATTTIDVGNDAPVAEITFPTTDTRFAVGQRLVLTGRATDAEDGPLPDSALSWSVVLHHDTHTHPFLTETTGNRIEITAPPPEDLPAAQTSYLAIRLTATDSRGVSRTVLQHLMPRMVDVNFASSPPGMTMTINGISVQTPYTARSWEGYQLQGQALSQWSGDDRWMMHAAWSDGVTTARRTFNTPASTVTYTETFREAPAPGLPATYHDNENFTGAAVTRTDPYVNYEWRTAAPLPSMGADTFSVRWNGRVQPMYSENYTFTLLSDEGARLWVDDTLVIDHWTPHTASSKSGTIALVAGRKYAIRVEYYDRTGNATARLYWQSARQVRQVVPQRALFPPANGLTATYYDDETFSTARFARLEPNIYWKWNADSPLGYGADETFGVRWEGRITPAWSEQYAFTAFSEGPIRMWVNGRLIIENWTEHSLVSNRASIALEAGKPVTIRVDYADRTGNAGARLYWSSARQPYEVVTSRFLQPK